MKEMKKSYESDISSYKSILDTTQKLMLEEKRCYEKTLQDLADLVDINTVKLNEINNKIHSVIDKHQLDFTTQIRWVINAQAASFEEVVKQNAALSEGLKKVILDYKLLSEKYEGSPTFRGPGIDSPEIVFIQKEANNECPTLKTEGQEMSTVKEMSSLKEVSSIAKDDTAEDMNKYFSANSSKGEKTEFTIGEVQKTESNDSHIKIVEEQTIANENKMTEPEELKFQFPQNQTDHNIEQQSKTLNVSNLSNKTNVSQKSNPNKSTSFTKNPKTNQSTQSTKNNDKKPNSKVSRDLLEKIKEVTSKKAGVSKDSYQLIKSNADASQEKSAQPPESQYYTVLHTESFKPEESAMSRLKTENLTEQISFNKKEHSKSNSLSSLQKILFGTQGSDDDLTKPLNTQEDFIGTLGTQENPEVKPNEDYFEGTGKFNSTRTVRSQTPNEDMMYKPSVSALQESIAQQIMQKASKNPTQTLRKVAQNIQKYKAAKAKEKSRSLEKSSSFGNKPKQALDPLSLVSPMKFSAITSPTSFERKDLSPISSRSQAAHAANSKPNQAKPGQNGQAQTCHIDMSRIFRKPADYTREIDRSNCANLQNFIKQKRRIFESPDVGNYCDNFDFQSPYHPMYSTGACSDSHAKNNLNLSLQSGYRPTQYARHSSVTHTQSDQNN